MATLVLSNHTPLIEDQLQTGGREVVVCLTKPAAALRMSANPPYRMLTVSHWAAYDELAGIACDLRGRIDRVATLWEGALIAAGFLRDLLDLPGQSMAEAAGFTDKAIMKSRLSRGGVPVARHRIVRTVDKVHTAASVLGGYPVVVKPLLGFGSTNTYVVRSFAELQSMRERVFDLPPATSDAFRAEPAFRSIAEQGAFLVEQYVDIRHEFHCDGFWRDGVPVYNVAGQYNIPPLQGLGGTLGSVLLDPAGAPGSTVASLAERAGRVLGMRDGFTHAEVYQDTGGRWLLGEIAARPGGGGIQPTLAHAHGIHVPAMIAQFAAGDPVQVDPLPADGVYGWAGPAVPPGRIIEIASRSALLRYPGVIDAIVTARVGTIGGPAGTGLWGGLAGYQFYRADSPQEILSMMDEVAGRFGIRVDPPATVPTR